MDGHAWIYFFAVTVIYLGGSITEAGEVDCSSYKEFTDKVKDCCKHKYNDDEEFDIEEVKELATKCAKKYAEGSPPSNRQEIKELMECVTECTLNGTKLMTTDMKINAELMLSYYDDKDEVDEWRKLWKTSVETCLDKTVKHSNPNSKCKSGMLYFLPCLSEETNINCPAELLDSTRKECDRMKVYFEKCSVFRTL